MGAGAPAARILGLGGRRTALVTTATTRDSQGPLNVAASPKERSTDAGHHAVSLKHAVLSEKGVMKGHGLRSAVYVRWPGKGSPQRWTARHRSRELETQATEGPSQAALNRLWGLTACEPAHRWAALCCELSQLSRSTREGDGGRCGGAGEEGGLGSGAQVGGSQE